MSRMYLCAAAAAAAVLVCASPAALAHGFAGQRFFPATILNDDPFVADEISLPTVTRNPTTPDGDQEIDIDVDLSKRITPRFGITLGDQWHYLQPEGLPAATGLGTLETGQQYQLFINGPHEAIGLIGLGETWAHTGRVQALGADDFTTLSPTFAFGKGFGDLPPSRPFLRPIAITGNLGFDLPLKSESAGTPNPDTFNYGFAFEYSLPYLECCVKDIGLRRPFSQLIPLVEIAFTTPINRIGASRTVGTIQPGIIWSGTYFQIGAEAIIPATGASGHGFGGVVQVHFYLDDLFPNTIGKPVSEW
ncbi:MAG TPA: hypothetical protein VJ770_16590 [Stellaceae bacterium]|nr:hypothetical protein [Stellaceae bacterium]